MNSMKPKRTGDKKASALPSATLLRLQNYAYELGGVPPGQVIAALLDEVDYNRRAAQERAELYLEQQEAREYIKSYGLARFQSRFASLKSKASGQGTLREPNDL